MADSVNTTMEIESLVEKKNKCLTGISRSIANFCVDKSRHGITDNTVREIKGFIKELPDDDKINILSSALVELAKVGNFGRKPSHTDDDMGNGYFNSSLTGPDSSDPFGGRKKHKTR